MAQLNASESSKRIKLSDNQLTVLTAAFDENQMPDAAKRQDLATQLGLTTRCVHVWFQNRRQRSRRPIQAHVATGGAQKLLEPEPAPPMEVEEEAAPAPEPEFASMALASCKVFNQELSVATVPPAARLLPPGWPKHVACSILSRL